MKVVRIKKQKDGSTKVTIDYTEEEGKMLIEYALVDILKKGIKKLRVAKNENKG